MAESIIQKSLGSPTIERTDINIAAGNVQLSKFVEFYNSGVLDDRHIHIFITELTCEVNANARFILLSNFGGQMEASSYGTAHSALAVAAVIGNNSASEIARYYITATPSSAITGKVIHIAIPV